MNKNRWNLFSLELKSEELRHSFASINFRMVFQLFFFLHWLNSAQNGNFRGKLSKYNDNRSDCKCIIIIIIIVCLNSNCEVAFIATQLIVAIVQKEKGIEFHSFYYLELVSKRNFRVCSHQALSIEIFWLILVMLLLFIHSIVVNKFDKQW